MGGKAPACLTRAGLLHQEAEPQARFTTVAPLRSYISCSEVWRLVRELAKAAVKIVENRKWRNCDGDSQYIGRECE